MARYSLWALRHSVAKSAGLCAVLVSWSLAGSVGAVARASCGAGVPGVPGVLLSVVVTRRSARLLPRNVDTVTRVTVSSAPAVDVTVLCSVLHTITTRESAPPSGWPWAVGGSRSRRGAVACELPVGGVTYL